MSVSLGKMFGVGCGDNSCVWGARGGMGTNGGCRCYERSTSQQTREQLEARMELRSGIFLLRELAALPKVEAALRELVERAARSVSQEGKP